MRAPLTPAPAWHAGLAVLAAGATLAGLWAVTALAVLWLVAVALSRHPASALVHVPTAWILLVAATSGMAMLTSLLKWHDLFHAVPMRLLVASLVLGAGVLCSSRLTTGPAHGPAESGTVTRPWWTFSAAAVLAASGLILVALPGSRSVGWALGGDHIHHLLFVAQVERVGGLDYAVASYPRAWHTVPATLVALAGEQQGPGALARLVAVTAASTWASFVVLVAAVTVTAARYAAAVGISQRHAAWAGALAGWLVLWPTVSVDYLGYGFQTSVLAATTLAVVVGEHLRAPGSTRSLVVGIVATGLMCHVWQLLVPVVGLATAVTLVCWWRARRRSGLPLGALVAGMLVVTGYATPAIWAVLGVGLDHATDAGLRPRVPLVVALLGIGAAVGVLLGVRRRRAPLAGAATRSSTLVVAVTTAVAAGLGCALAARYGLSPLTYYPGKLIWHSAVLGIVALPAAAVLVVQAVAPRVGPTALMAASAVVVGLGLVAPLSVLTGRLSDVDADLVLSAATTSEADQAQVVWLSGTEYDDLVTRVLLRYDDERIDPTGRSDSYPSRAEECALLRRADRPAVLSDRALDDVRARYACVPMVQVVRVPTP